ncbi:hypothetical protein LPTSP4_29020 [Leptospira ryugenii]|uniref:Uncharacterized protein n=1 Tax=Leptospira ryugenii TaxID=1917863 RepID=A0A2P2E3G4_9LEPT|nr:hypothetical protein LPTSP4_29020 [Leptospira ryugenii]
MKFTFGRTVNVRLLAEAFKLEIELLAGWEKAIFELIELTSIDLLNVTTIFEETLTPVAWFAGTEDVTWKGPVAVVGNAMIPSSKGSGFGVQVQVEMSSKKWIALFIMGRLISLHIY